MVWIPSTLSLYLQYQFMPLRVILITFTSTNRFQSVAAMVLYSHSCWAFFVFLMDFNFIHDFDRPHTPFFFFIMVLLWFEVPLLLLNSSTLCGHCLGVISSGTVHSFTNYPPSHAYLAMSWCIFLDEYTIWIWG